MIHTLFSVFIALLMLGPITFSSQSSTVRALMGPFYFWLWQRTNEQKKVYKTDFSLKVLFYYFFTLISFSCTMLLTYVLHMFFCLFSDGKAKVIWKSFLIQHCLMCSIIAWHHMKVIRRLFICSVNVKTRWKLKEEPSKRGGKLLGILEPHHLCLWAHRTHTSATSHATT